MKNNIDWSGADPVNNGYLLKTDNVGNLEWHKQFFNKNYLYSSTFSAVAQQQLDSNYFTAGHAYDSPNPDNLDGCLLAVKSNGDSLWSKFYSHYGATTQEYIYDIQPTKDGGFIMCGNAWGGPNGQDMWLVKTDCMGNADKWDSVNCPLNVGEKELEVKSLQVQVEVYPNPFSESTTIRIMNNEQGIMNYEMEIYDLLGRQVQHQTLNFKQETLNLDLSEGIYFYKITDNKEVLAAGKLVISD